jgi:hypothetical protein
VYERFTDEARQAVVRAQTELSRLGHRAVGTEHLLLGVLAVDDATVEEALERWGVDVDAARDRVEALRGVGYARASGHVRFTAAAKAALERAARGADTITTPHLLLGLVHPECTATRVLADLGVDLAALRRNLQATLPPPGESPAVELARSGRDVRPPRPPRSPWVTFDALGDDAWGVLLQARRLARELRHASVDPLHVLAACELVPGDARNALMRVLGEGAAEAEPAFGSLTKVLLADLVDDDAAPAAVAGLARAALVLDAFRGNALLEALGADPDEVRRRLDEAAEG